MRKKPKSGRIMTLDAAKLHDTAGHLGGKKLVIKCPVCSHNFRAGYGHYSKGKCDNFLFWDCMSRHRARYTMEFIAHQLYELSTKINVFIPVWYGPAWQDHYSGMKIHYMAKWAKRLVRFLYSSHPYNDLEFYFTIVQYISSKIYDDSNDYLSATIREDVLADLSIPYKSDAQKCDFMRVMETPGCITELFSIDTAESENCMREYITIADQIIVLPG